MSGNPTLAQTLIKFSIFYEAQNFFYPIQKNPAFSDNRELNETSPLCLMDCGRGATFWCKESYCVQV